jgi:hypothetical protein
MIGPVVKNTFWPGLGSRSAVLIHMAFRPFCLKG